MTRRPMARRSVRVDSALWSRALEVADERGETVSDVVRRALLRYVGGRPASVPAPLTRPPDGSTVDNAAGERRATGGAPVTSGDGAQINAG